MKAAVCYIQSARRGQKARQLFRRMMARKRAGLEQRDRHSVVVRPVDFPGNAMDLHDFRMCFGLLGNLGR